MFVRVRRAAIAVAVVLAVFAAGCGQQPADLFVVTRDGTIAGAHLVLRVTDDGHAVCNGAAEREITSHELIVAREVARDLSDAADAGLVLAPRPGSTLRYAVRLQSGTVRFADNSLHQTAAMFKAALLARDIAKGACGLPR